MKKIIPLLLIICLLLTSCQLTGRNDFELHETTAETSAEQAFSSVKQAEMRGVWISCYDHISAAGKTKTE